MRKKVVHPGERLRKEYLKPLRMTVVDAAERCLITRKAMSEFVNGDSSVSVDMAIRLSKAFGTTVAEWLTRQMEYDLATIVPRRAKSIQIRRVRANEYRPVA